MIRRSALPRGAILAAAACLGLCAAPQIAAAQPSDDQGGQGGTYYDPCARSQADRSLVGGLLGAVAGATLGNSVTHGGAKLGGALIGGAVGAAAGAGIGHATAACQPGQPVPYASMQSDPRYAPPPPQGYAPPDEDRQGYGPPPPPQGYVPPDDGQPGYGPPPPPPPPNGYAPPPDDPRYADRDMRDDRGDYAAPPPPPGEQCQMVEDRAFFPDGTTESSTVRACRDERGHWRVED